MRSRKQQFTDEGVRVTNLIENDKVGDILNHTPILQESEIAIVARWLLPRTLVFCYVSLTLTNFMPFSYIWPCL